MAELPTTNDYLEHVAFIMREQREELRREIDGIIAKRAAAGGLRSGATLIQIGDVTKKRLRDAAGLAFSEEKHAIRNVPTMDEEEVEAATVQVLRNFHDEIRALAHAQFDKLVERNSKAYRTAVERMALDANLERFIKSQRHGFGGSKEPVAMPSTVNNNISIGTSIGSAIQQGSEGATQTVSNNINVELARQAVAALETAIGQEGATSPVVDDLKADLVAIKAQLQKQKPEPTLLRSLGASLRNVTEGAIGGALSPAIIQASALLVSALGG